MLDLIFRCMVGLSGIFMLPPLLVHALTPPAFDAGGLIHLITPSDDCRQPCFLGIRPGETTLRSAALLLQDHDEVRFLVLNEDYSNHNTQSRIVWEYQLPDGVLEGHIFAENFIVQRVSIYDIPLADVWLALGQPDASRFIGEDGIDTFGNPIYNPVMHIGFYGAFNLRMISPAACGSYWLENAQLSLTPDNRAVNLDIPADEDRMTMFRQQACYAWRHNHRPLAHTDFLNRLTQTYEALAHSL